MNTPKIATLITAPARRERDLARQVAGLLAQMEHSAWTPALRQMMDNAVHRIALDGEPVTTWDGGYVMLNPKQCGVVWRAIRKLPAAKRPQDVRAAFDLALENLRWDTGEVMLRRDELAEQMECHADKVSSAMGVLQSWGVVRREVMRVAGMKGQGIVTYFVNPHVAWRGALTGRAEQAAQVEPPLLRLMEGGRDTSKE